MRPQTTLSSTPPHHTYMYLKKTGNETIVTAYTSCANGQATVAFWEMEGAAHTPAFSPKATDDMLAVLLGPKDKEQKTKATTKKPPARWRR